MKSKPTIIFEDDDLIIVNKPAHFLTIPDRFILEKPNLLDFLKKKYDDVFVVHRLDKETSGVICFAKNEVSHRNLNQQFENRTVDKYYLAIADAVKAMNMFLLPSVNVPILGVVENMSWFTPKELPDNKYFIFGQGGGEEMVKQSKSVLLGKIPIIQGIREAGDEGKPAIVQNEPALEKYFMEVANNTVREVVVRNENQAPTKIVNVK